MIRAYQEKDMEQVIRLWQKETILAHPFIPREYWEAHTEEIRDQYLPQAQTIVWEGKEGVKGFLSLLEGEWIGALFVERSSQGRGIGSALLEYCKKRYPRLQLAVYCENTAAVRFYQGQAFQVTEKVPGDAPEQMEYRMAWTRKGPGLIESHR